MRKFFLLLIILVLLGIGGSVVIWNSSLSPVDAQDHSEKMFSVHQGSGVNAVANDLKQAGLIKSALIFRIMAQQSGLDKKIIPGDFKLSPAMTAREIAVALTKGIADITITIPEGKRAEEVAVILRDKMPNYEESWETELKAHEGYLFPETYNVRPDADIASIIELLTNTFNERYSKINTRNSEFNQDQIVILASLIEREARHDNDRYIISSVLHNRLELGMALQIDATVQYALGYDTYEKSWWKKGLTYDDLKVRSSYNTYLNPGLPPGPIASPGEGSLKAAAKPSNTDYLYYITDKNGVNHYAKTNAQHEANIRRYGL